MLLFLSAFPAKNLQSGWMREALRRGRDLTEAPPHPDSAGRDRASERLFQPSRTCRLVSRLGPCAPHKNSPSWMVQLIPRIHYEPCGFPSPSRSDRLAGDLSGLAYMYLIVQDLSSKTRLARSPGDVRDTASAAGSSMPPQSGTDRRSGPPLRIEGAGPSIYRFSSVTTAGRFSRP